MKMRDEDDMERFIAEQRTRIAHERETLERNPPSAVTDYIMDGTSARRPHNEFEKDVTQADAPRDTITNTKSVKTKPPTPQILKLGEAYNKQKEKLKEELRQDYRRALAEKQVRTTGVRGKIDTEYEQGLSVNLNKKDDLDLGLSLPIRDHLSAKERLRLQRNREYNEFKSNKENEEKQNSPRRLTTYATAISYPTPHVSEMTQTTPKDEPKPKIKESYNELLERKRRQEKAYRNDDDDLDDKIVYRERTRRRIIDDDEEYAPSRKVRFPQKRRPRYVDRYYDNEDEEDSEEELIRRLRARRQRRGVTNRRYVESDDELDDEALFERVRPKESVHQEGKRRLNSARNTTHKVNVETDKHNDLRSKSAPPDQEYTGLPIGKVASANTVQRRKDEYKLDLQRQMEENDKNKKRSKLLEMQIDASGANDPEKKPNRLHDLSPRQQKQQQNEVEVELKKPKKKGKKKTSFRDDSLESDSEDDRRRRLPRQRQPNYYVPPPMNSYYQPPPTQFPSPYDEAYYYYGARNPLDPAAMTGAPLNAPQTAFQPGSSPLLLAAGARNTAPPEINENRKETMQIRPSVGRATTFNANTESSLVSDDSRDALKKRELMQTYQEELKAQMNLKERKKREERLEQERYERKIEMEAMSYNPWGKGGGGAPMKDVHGNLVSDLRQMHLINEDLVRDPTKVAELAKQRQQIIETTEEIFQPTPRNQDTAGTGILSPRFGRSNPFELKETSEQKSQKDVYKDELQKQIEERRRIEAERKDKLRKIEEKEEQKMQEENRKMQEEYEKEKKKQQEKIEQQRRKNEEMQHALDEKRQDDERKKKDEQMRREEEERAAKERELQDRLRQQASPPIRVQEEDRPLNTDRSTVPRHETQNKQITTEKVYHQVVEQPAPTTYERRRTPPVVVRPDKSRESKRISRELSALRKQLLNEQQRIENQLRTSDQPALQFGSYQPTTIKTENLVDLSRARQRPVQVRRPPTVDRPNSKALREFTDFKHRQDDTTSLRMFRIQHPDTPSNTNDLEKQQEDMIKNQMMKIEALKNNNTFEMPHHSRRSPTKSSRNGFTLLPPSESYASLLDAETTYIPVVDDNDLENQPPPSPPRRARKTSARERRRISKRSDDEGGLTYRAAPDNYSLNSLNSLATLDVDRLANKNQDRLDKLKALQGDEVSLTDPDDILDRFVNQHKSDLPDTPDTFAPNLRRPRKGTSISAPQQDRPPSVNTVDTELWLRPGTGPAATTT